MRTPQIGRNLSGVALFAIASFAQAQSNVTVFGVVDNNLTYGKGSISNAKSVGSGGLAGSRIGFRGVEDLGDGLRATFVLEHGLFSDTGATTPVFWNRRTTVGLVGPWGDVQLGRTYTPTFIVHNTYDAFGPQGVAAQQVLLGSMEFMQPANVRANNAIDYRSPTWNGFVLHAMTSASEGAPGKYSGVRAGYAGGGLAVDAAYGTYDNPAIGDLKAVTVGARYKLGAFTVYGLVDRADSGSSFDTRGVQVSGMYLWGNTELKASVAQSKRRDAAGADAGTVRRFGIGAVHHLSKRTALYTSIATVRNSDRAATSLNGSQTAPNEPSSGMDIGIRHSF